MPCEQSVFNGKVLTDGHASQLGATHGSLMCMSVLTAPAHLQPCMPGSAQPLSCSCLTLLRVAGSSLLL